MPGYVVSPQTGRKPSEKLWDWFTSRHKWISDMLELPLRVWGVLREVLHLAWGCHNRQVHQDHFPQPRQLWPESRRHYDGPPYEQRAYSKRYTNSTNNLSVSFNAFFFRSIPETFQGFGCAQTEQEEYARAYGWRAPRRERWEVCRLPHVPQVRALAREG